MNYFFGSISPVLKNSFLYFSRNDKNPLPLTYFLVLGSIEYHRTFLSKSNFKLTLTSISNGLTF